MFCTVYPHFRHSSVKFHCKSDRAVYIDLVRECCETCSLRDLVSGICAVVWRDLLTAVAHPLALAARPLQAERPELKQYHNPSLSGICAVAMRLCTSLPACGGALQNTNKKGDQVNLSPFSLCFAESEVFETLIQHPPQ